MTIEQYIELIKYGIWPVAILLARYMHKVDQHQKDIDHLAWMIRGKQIDPKTGRCVGMRNRTIKGRWKRMKHKIGKG